MEWEIFLDKQSRRHVAILRLVGQGTFSLETIAPQLEIHPKTLKRSMESLERKVPFLHIKREKREFMFTFDEEFTIKDAILFIFSTSQQFTCLRDIMWHQDCYNTNRYPSKIIDSLNEQLKKYQILISKHYPKLIGDELKIRAFMLHFCSDMPDFVPIISIEETLVSRAITNNLLHDVSAYHIYLIVYLRQKVGYSWHLTNYHKLFVSNNPFFFQFSQELKDSFIFKEQIYFYLCLIAKNCSWGSQLTIRESLTKSKDFLVSTLLEETLDAFHEYIPYMFQVDEHQIPEILGQHFLRVGLFLVLFEEQRQEESYLNHFLLNYH